MRIVVVGGGVIGLLTALECVRAGAQVELLDQADIPAPLATSNDRYRVVRALHRGDACLTLAAARGRQAWADLERILGARFYLRTGLLTVMPEAAVPASLALLTAAGVTGHEVPAAALPARYPALRVPPGEAGVFEPQAGAILASEALLALARWLREQPGVTLRPLCQVTEVVGSGAAEPGAARSGAVRLADGSTLSGDGVVVAAGAWSRAILPAEAVADLTLIRQTMLTYDPGPGSAPTSTSAPTLTSASASAPTSTPASAPASTPTSAPASEITFAPIAALTPAATPVPAPPAWAGMPVVIGLGPGHDAWLMPPAAGTPARLSAASALRVVPEITGRAAPAAWRDHLVGRFAGLLADFDPARVTGAADGYYLNDPAGQGPRLAAVGDGAVWAYPACGGMSFKIAPLVAGALADRAMGRPPRRTGLDSIDRPWLFAREGRNDEAART